MKFRQYDPKAEEAGYLRRRLLAMRFYEALEADPSAANLEAVIDFILEHTLEPEDKDEARDQLLDLTADEYSKVIGEILKSDGEVDPKPDGD